MIITGFESDNIHVSCTFSSALFDDKTEGRNENMDLERCL